MPGLPPTVEGCLQLRPGERITYWTRAGATTGAAFDVIRSGFLITTTRRVVFVQGGGLGTRPRVRDDLTWELGSGITLDVKSKLGQIYLTINGGLFRTGLPRDRATLEAVRTAIERAIASASQSGLPAQGQLSGSARGLLGVAPLGSELAGTVERPFTTGSAGQREAQPGSGQATHSGPLQAAWGPGTTTPSGASQGVPGAGQPDQPGPSQAEPGSGQAAQSGPLQAKPGSGRTSPAASPAMAGGHSSTGIPGQPHKWLSGKALIAVAIAAVVIAAGVGAALATGRLHIADLLPASGGSGGGGGGRTSLPSTFTGTITVEANTTSTQWGGSILNGTASGSGTFEVTCRGNLEGQCFYYGPGTTEYTVLMTLKAPPPSTQLPDLSCMPGSLSATLTITQSVELGNSVDPGVYWGPNTTLYSGPNTADGQNFTCQYEFGGISGDWKYETINAIDIASGFFGNLASGGPGTIPFSVGGSYVGESLQYMYPDVWWTVHVTLKITGGGTG